LTEVPAATCPPRLVAAEAVSNFGSMLSRVAIPWVATLMLGATPFEMGLLLVANVAAGAAGSLALGVWVDRRGKRGVMIASDLARAAVIGVLAWVVMRGHVAFWMLVVAAAASGILTMAFELARSAWVAQRVAVAALAGANARLSAASSVAETAAFALGGWLYQGFGAAVSLVVDAVSYVASALFVRGVPEAPAAPREASGHAWRDFRREAAAGVRLVTSHPSLRALAWIQVLASLGMALAGTSYMIYVVRDLAFETGALGMIFAAGGLGALAGAAAAPWLGRRLGAGRAIGAGLALTAAAALLAPLAPAATFLGAALLVANQVLGDGAWTVWEVHDRTLRQVEVPAELLARADAGLRTLSESATLVGALVGGWAASEVGARAALFAAAGLFALAALACFSSNLVRRP
jgi:predicted MFS family arabinose efflux permease